MVKRVSVKSGKAEAVVPPAGETITGLFEFTILNTSTSITVELVESESTAFGQGFPLAPGAAWSGQVNSTQKLYVISNSGTAASIAVIGVPAA